MKTLKVGVRQQLTPYDDKSANLFFGTVTTTTATATAAQCSLNQDSMVAKQMTN